MEICWKCTQDADDLEKFSFTSLAHQWIFCSEYVPSEWVQTADKNISNEKGKYKTNSKC